MVDFLLIYSDSSAYDVLTVRLTGFQSWEDSQHLEPPMSVSCPWHTHSGRSVSADASGEPDRIQS